MRKIRQLKHGDIRITIYPKTGARIGKSTGKRRKKRMSWSQAGEFLNRYDFAHSGRHTVNQIGKIAPGIINRQHQTLIILLKNELTRQSEQVGQKSKESHQK